MRLAVNLPNHRKLRLLLLPLQLKLYPHLLPNKASFLNRLFPQGKQKADKCEFIGFFIEK
jgi:hypothetical protein